MVDGIERKFWAFTGPVNVENELFVVPMVRKWLKYNCLHFQWSCDVKSYSFFWIIFLKCLHYGPEMYENVLFGWELFLISFTVFHFSYFLHWGFDKVYGKVLAFDDCYSCLDEKWVW